MLLAAGCAATPEMSAWERENTPREAPREEVVVPPAFPTRAKLVEFSVAEMGDVRFFIDGSTLGVDKNGVVRYVLVAQSPGGAQNVTFEALRCAAGQHRLSATGRTDRTWTPSSTPWQPVTNARRWHIALYREYFCPQKVPIRSADEGVRALQAGGHPFSKGLNSPNLGL